MGGHRPGRRGDQAPGADGGQSVAALVDALRPLDPGRAELLGRAAHDLRTPLTVITGCVELLADGAAGPITEDQLQILNTLTRNADQLLTLVGVLDPPAGDGG